MSDQKKTDGGPAFPIYGKLNEWGYAEQPGMTLRDYFAAKAMAALVLATEQKYLSDPIKHEACRASEDSEYVAQDAYAIADAMLNEREQ